MSLKQKKLFLTSLLEEANICARCSYCNSVCCTHRELDWESTSPRGWLALIRGFGGNFPPIERFPEPFVQRVYDCTLCGKCGEVCPVHIDLRSLWIELREEIVGKGQGPAFTLRLKEAEAREHNVFDFPNEERAEWVEFMTNPPPHRYQKEKADVLYYVGCVSSFSAAAQGIPKAFGRLLEKAGVNFSILGGNEWCCGFPLIVAGLGEEANALREHNLEQLRRIEAKTVVFNCPSCYHTWKNHYYLENVELLHSTQFLARLIHQGKLRLGSIEARVSYHDPCDLGRNSGIYDEPRQVLSSIPGLDFVELLHHRSEALCCGGGGDFEMLEPSMTQAIASRLIEEAHLARAQLMVVACPQCKRIEMSGVEALRSSIKVVDIAELVLQAVTTLEEVVAQIDRGGKDG